MHRAVARGAASAATRRASAAAALRAVQPAVGRRCPGERALASAAEPGGPPAEGAAAARPAEAIAGWRLRAHAAQSGVPMVGFGVVDCIVMTQVGSTIDSVLGSALGISAMTAAAIGLFCSDSCGVLFGGTIESFAGRLGLPQAAFTADQMGLPQVRRAATLGRLLGVQLGVLLGSTTLLLTPAKKPPAEAGDAAVAQGTAAPDEPDDIDALERQIALLKAKVEAKKAPAADAAA